MSRDEPGIELVERFPGVEDYVRLRREAGMDPKTEDAARRGLPGTLYGVSLVRGGEAVGMGRVIGDGGTFLFVSDIAVVPTLQGRGLGRRIMAALDAWLRTNAPPSAYVGLVADGPAKHLYAKFGFREVGDRSVYMEYIAPREG